MLYYELYLTNFPNLQVVPLDHALAQETALVRAATRLRMPDAIQVAAARLPGADAIVTNDHRWANRVGQITLITPDDYLDQDPSLQDRARHRRPRAHPVEADAHQLALSHRVTVQGARQCANA